MTRVPKADGGIEFRAPADVVTPIHHSDRDPPPGGYHAINIASGIHFALRSCVETRLSGHFEYKSLIR